MSTKTKLSSKHRSPDLKKMTGGSCLPHPRWESRSAIDLSFYRRSANPSSECCTMKTNRRQILALSYVKKFEKTIPLEWSRL